MSSEPAWALTDEALVLVLHAESDMTRATATSGSELFRGPPRRDMLTAARLDVLWLRESAVLRLVSTVEAYTDAASRRCTDLKGLQPPAKPPFSWDQRIKHYSSTHAIDLTTCAGWREVQAGVNLRNCLAHGLGALTPYLLADPDIGQQMLSIHVDVHSGRMHSRTTTVPLLGAACREYVLDLESQLLGTL